MGGGGGGGAEFQVGVGPMSVAHKLLGGIGLLRVVLRHSETDSGPSSCGVTDRFLFVAQVKVIRHTYMTVVAWCEFI